MARFTPLYFADRCMTQTRGWLYSKHLHLTVPQASGLALLFVAGFVLRSETLFAFREAALFFSFALISIVPLGAVIVQSLFRDLESKSVRAALIGITGFAASMILGFMLGALGVQGMYLPMCLGLLVVWLVQLYLSTSARHGIIQRVVAMFNLGNLWNSQSLWLLGVVALASVLATMPFLAPRVRVMNDLVYDYSYVDQHYHLTHALMFLQGAPLRTWPDLAGTQPLVYPDYHNFWMGQMAAWSNIDIDGVFYVYAPVAMIFLNTLLLYAFGRSVTGSPWGGYVAAALGYLVFLPNPYEPNLFLRDVEVPKWILVRTHFLEFASAPSYGVGWQLLTGTALCVWLAKSKQTLHTQVGALIVGSILLVALLRIRSHFFVVMAPPFLLLIGWLIFKRRDWRLIIPLGVFALLLGAVFLESTSSYYNISSLGIGFAYGPASDQLIKYSLPPPLDLWVTRLPAPSVPIAAICLYILTRLSGAAYAFVLAIGLIQWMRKKWHPGPVDYFLWAVLGCTILAASIVVYPEYLEVGGNWAGQALFIVPRIILLLAVVPLFSLLRQINRSSVWIQAHNGQFAMAAIVVFSVVAFRGASATLHQQDSRAYPHTGQELGAYNWIKANTPPNVVVAAHPAHVVNQHGDTIMESHVLTTMTHRAAFVQKEIGANVLQGAEIARRRQTLEDLFTSTTPDQIRKLISTTNIDYVLVYPDTPPSGDFSCCMKLVYGKSLKIYQVPHNVP